MNTARSLIFGSLCMCVCVCVAKANVIHCLSLLFAANYQPSTILNKVMPAYYSSLSIFLHLTERSIQFDNNYIAIGICGENDVLELQGLNICI